MLPLFKCSLQLINILKSPWSYLLRHNIILLRNKSLKLTYVSVLQDTVQGTHDLAVSLNLFSSAGQQYGAHTLGCGSSHGALGTQCCAGPPFLYSNLQYYYYFAFQMHRKVKLSYAK